MIAALSCLKRQRIYFKVKGNFMTSGSSRNDSNLESIDTQRRNLLLYGITALVGTTLIARTLYAATSSPAPAVAGDVTIENFSAAGKSEGSVKVAKVIKTDAEWKSALTADSYQVARREGTERPYSGKYEHNHADGLYHCICCNTVLFDSKTKFESGTGWPSFWQPISKQNVSEISDRTFGMVRTAVACRRCDAHLGHVFEDGPKPTGLRYCMNSVSLNFVARA
jgi:peptide-methionine (R)-S-oxide reductase